MTSAARPDAQHTPAASADPAGQLLELSFGYLYSAALHTAARLGIADHLADGPRTAEQLAQAAQAHGPHLRRLLRFLATKGVFRQDKAGRFHLTPLAEPLRTGVDGSLRDYVMMRGEDVFWLPAARLPDAVRTGGTAFEQVYGVPFYDHLAAHPEVGAAFHSSMAAFSQTLSDDVADACDFSSVRSVVDVGGGRGGLLKAVLLRNPGVTGVLFDREPVVASHVLDIPELAGRWQAEAGDFFSSVPAGADVYLLKHVLASWPDEECVRILRACGRAAPAGGRLLVVNGLIPEGNEPHPGKTHDMLMMTVLNGKGRTRREYEDLLARAGLTVRRVDTLSAHASVIEAVADGC
ncbi:methyltransferase [Streptomyces qinglanensis]|uniref:Dimerisation domain-containing protein n=1 Tax=Streptomyces qinglanensis TaxID=943816 RepID=A0A1H9R706_9ACTN|nr:methyltransferase [Streptomyces qinglanensis]SER68315.1 Dimerisation domain-containing protein [Streptomyces qinglanensis]